MKLGILVWAMLPQTQGASFIYNNFLKDFISSAEAKVAGAPFFMYSSVLLHCLILCTLRFSFSSCTFATAAVKESKKDT